MSLKGFLKGLLRLACLSAVSSIALHCILKGIGVDFGNVPYMILGAIIGIFVPVDDE